MRENRSKLMGIMIFLLLISCLLFLIFYTTESTNKGEILMIEITGNNLLSETDYLTFSQLDNLKGYENVTLPLIKDRLEKHPYVVSADVELENQNKTKVILKEKKIMAVVLGGREPYFITEEFQILPLFTNTKFSDLPVISNPKKSDSLKPLEIFKDEDIIEAFKIIDAARLTNKNILKRLSEINLRNG